MRLVKVASQSFRNLKALALETDASFVVVTGNNAQGKTNFLESIYFLGTLKPLKGRLSGELVGWGEDKAAVAGWVQQPAGHVVHHRVDFHKKGRELKVDGQSSSAFDYFRTIRAIRFIPSDGSIVVGEPSIRRGWLDRAAFTADPGHLRAVQAVRRVLSQKSACLRADVIDHSVLDVLNDQLCHHSAILVQRRQAILAELKPHLTAVHQQMTGGDERLSLRYATYTSGDTLEERAQSLRDRLSAVRERELRRQSTLAGPQLDDLKFLLDDRPARKFGSRGQVRALVLSLKLAETVAAQARGDSPLFLIDDVSSELDRQRTGRLVQVLGELKVQVFLSTTDVGQLDLLPPSETMVLQVVDGNVQIV